MAAYLPPLENLPIFNSEIFIDGTDLLDINTANKLYLRFPYAQGTQNMLDVNMLGDITFPSATGLISFSSSGNTLNAQGWTGYVNSTVSSLNSTYYLTLSDSSLSGIGPLLKNQNFNINPNTNEIAIGNFLKIGGASTKKILIGSGAGTTNQGNNSIAIGALAGVSSQGSESIAFGLQAGNSGQLTSAIAIGQNAGFSNQGAGTVAIGRDAGATTQLANTVAIGRNAGNSNQNIQSVAIGYESGTTSQGSSSVAVGYLSGNNTQGTGCVAIGITAGRNNQGNNATAVGPNAGTTSQGVSSVAIGFDSGTTSQGSSSVAIGVSAGKTSQGVSGVAIGNLAGEVNQGLNCIAIGAQSGRNNGATAATNTICIGNQAGINGVASNSIIIGNLAGNTDRSGQATGSIVLNASGSTLDTPNDGSFMVNPIRARTTNASGFPLFYNGNEITQHNSTNTLIFQTPISTGGTIRLSPRVSTPLPFVIECDGTSATPVLNINTPIRLQTNARTLTNQDYLGYYIKINASLNIGTFTYGDIVQLTPVINLNIGTYMVNFYFEMSGAIPGGNANATLNYLNYNLSTSTTAFGIVPIVENRVISGIRLRDDNTTREFSYNVSRVLTQTTASSLYLIFQADFTGIGSGSVFSPTINSYVEIVKIA